MRFQNIIEQVYFRPWYITPAGHAAIDRIVRSRLLRGDSSGADVLPRAEDGINLMDLFQQRRPMEIDADGIATIHVYGPLGKGLSKLEKTCGCTGYEDLRADLLAAQSQARGILLHVDSPGGTVVGCPEIAELVVESSIPVVAYTEDLMASAAYFIASGARSIVASSSCSVGSIGVYIPWIDRSALYAAEGLRPDPIVNDGGDLKALGFGGSLTRAQRDYLQDQVNEDFEVFSRHVTQQRSIPREAMRGQVLTGRSALPANLINHLGDLSFARAKLLEFMPRT